MGRMCSSAYSDDGQRVARLWQRSWCGVLVRMTAPVADRHGRESRTRIIRGKRTGSEQRLHNYAPHTTLTKQIAAQQISQFEQWIQIQHESIARIPG